MSDAGSGPGLALAREKMLAAGVDPLAIDVFAHYFRLLERGETGMIPEATIDPHDMGSIEDVEVSEEAGRAALAGTAVIKLNGGLGTSMGMERAKSLLCVRRGLSFLDIIARQVLHLRAEHGVTLPLIFMNSFRTSADTLAALARYEDLPVAGLPLEFLQNKEPKLGSADLKPVSWTRDPSLEWCPPGHGDIYTALTATGLLDTLIAAGYERLFISNSDNLGAVPSPLLAGWFATSGAPFAIEAVRRTASDRKGGHFAYRKSDGRIVLRETRADAGRGQGRAGRPRPAQVHLHQQHLDRPGGAAQRARPPRRDPRSAADPQREDRRPERPVQPRGHPDRVRDGRGHRDLRGRPHHRVGRDRYVPVKTTNDLLVLRSDVYDIGADFVLDQVAEMVPFIDLDGTYKLVGDFDKRFKAGAPSLRKATSFVVTGDWDFGADVTVVGEATLDGERGRVEAGSVLGT